MPPRFYRFFSKTPEARVSLVLLTINTRTFFALFLYASKSAGRCLLSGAPFSTPSSHVACLDGARHVDLSSSSPSLTLILINRLCDTIRVPPCPFYSSFGSS
ncbi:hypothetical protein LY76DRAFT_85182 [Colletotrichum caudatum]|nr:hypothetical protein LY76DRAFT_85182 [Colletotrichum caudatum]